MRRLISVLVAVFFMTGMVVAQNTSTTTQDGKANTAEVNQTLDEGSNTSTVGQYGGENLPNEVTVDQTTTNAGINISNVQQGYGGADLMTAEVNQSADNGENFSDIFQGNNVKTAKVDQEAKTDGYNESYITQTSGGKSDPLSTVNITQIALDYNSANGGQNISDINQSGIGSEADVYQKAYVSGDNNSEIGQNGSYLDADVTQYHAGSGFVDSWIDQIGANNQSNVWQKAINVGGINESDVGQYGGENGANIVDVDQEVYHTGTNTSTITQGKESNSSADRNEAVVDQYAEYGGTNESTLEQVNNSHYAEIDQIANGGTNSSVIYQGGHSYIGDGGWIDLEQTANGGQNISDINQHANYPNHMEEARATVTQTTNGGINDLDLDQYGKFNTATVTQTHNVSGGLMNSAVIEQYGNGQNTVTVNQIGAGNSATEIQTNL